MTKKDLLLIHSFIDSKNPKEVLNFAHLKDDGIYATDTQGLYFEKDFYCKNWELKNERD